MRKNKTFRNLIIIVLAAFAVLTLFIGSATLFDWFGIQAKQGNLVPFVVKTNITVAVLYLF